jgi:predicted phage terminase large subunit-like protein
LYKAFCGGIGSGTSWALSYDIIKRAKPGRLYAMISPTYTMLADASMRSFITVASHVGVINVRDLPRRGTAGPVNIKLKTASEILFRSADDPSRLYGPNLSGIVLDEASLMSADTFSIGIGRLREAGESGWLSAGFTPKGRQHWTYEVFATGRPNTEIIYCKTRDNIFLPADFYENVRSQYTSGQALQELEGAWVDTEGGLFQAKWFGTVKSVPKLVSRVRAWDLAATPKDERRAHDPDYTVGALWGKGEDGTVYVLDIKRLRGSPQAVESAVRTTAEWDGKAIPIWMEQEPGSSGATVVDHYARRVLMGWNFRAERSTGEKSTRAQPLAAAAERGLVKLVEAHWNKDLLDEVSIFPFANHDDQVDSLALGFNKLASKRTFWMRICGESIGGDTKEKAVKVQKPGSQEWVEYSAATGRQIVTQLPAKDYIDIRPDAPGWQPYRRF